MKGVALIVAPHIGQLGNNKNRKEPDVDFNCVGVNNRVSFLEIGDRRTLPRTTVVLLFLVYE